MKIPKKKASNILKNIKKRLPSMSRAVTGGAGLAALGLVAYDAHYYGKIQSDLYSSQKDADSLAYYVNNAMYLNKPSKVREGIKNTALRMELNQTWKRFFREGIGYVKGFASTLFQNIVPTALGITALVSKGKPGKYSAIGLAVYAGYEVIKNTFGLGIPPGFRHRP